MEETKGTLKADRSGETPGAILAVPWRSAVSQMSVVLNEQNLANSTSRVHTAVHSKLVRRFFLAGLWAAIFWIAASYATRGDQIPVHISDAIAHLIWDFERITFPFVLSFPLTLANLKSIPGQILLLALAAAMNGGWFALLGVIGWYIREAVFKWRSARNSQSGRKPG